MLNIRQQSVNVSRPDLLVALKAGLEVHKAQYAEMTEEYKLAVVAFMVAATNRAKNGDFKNLRMDLTSPRDHSQEYIDVIEMMEVSVDSTIQLDKEAYKAYYKNEWSWSSGLEASASLYKSIIGGKL